jgi:hypothetical protein
MPHASCAVRPLVVVRPASARRRPRPIVAIVLLSRYLNGFVFLPASRLRSSRRRKGAAHCGRTKPTIADCIRAHLSAIQLFQIETDDVGVTEVPGALLLYGGSCGGWRRHTASVRRARRAPVSISARPATTTDSPNRPLRAFNRCLPRRPFEEGLVCFVCSPADDGRLGAGRARRFLFRPLPGRFITNGSASIAGTARFLDLGLGASGRGFLGRLPGRIGYTGKGRPRSPSPPAGPAVTRAGSVEAAFEECFGDVDSGWGTG